MTIKSSLGSSRQTVGGYLKQYAPPVPETPDSLYSSVESAVDSTEAHYSAVDGEAEDSPGQPVVKRSLGALRRTTSSLLGVQE